MSNHEASYRFLTGISLSHTLLEWQSLITKLSYNLVLRTASKSPQRQDSFMKGVSMSKNKKGVPTPSCAHCEQPQTERICMTESGKGSKRCPTLTPRKVLDEANQVYDDPAVREFARQSQPNSFMPNLPFKNSLTADNSIAASTTINIR